MFLSKAIGLVRAALTAKVFFLALRTGDANIQECPESINATRPDSNGLANQYRVLYVPAHMADQSENNAVDHMRARRLCCVFTRIIVVGPTPALYGYNETQVGFRATAEAQKDFGALANEVLDFICTGGGEGFGVRDCFEAAECLGAQHVSNNTPTNLSPSPSTRDFHPSEPPSSSTSLGSLSSGLSVRYQMDAGIAFPVDRVQISEHQIQHRYELEHGQQSAGVLDFCHASNPNMTDSAAKYNFRHLSIPTGWANPHDVEGQDSNWAAKLCCIFIRIESGGVNDGSNSALLIDYNGKETEFQAPSFCEMAENVYSYARTTPDGRHDVLMQGKCLSKIHHIASCPAPSNEPTPSPTVTAAPQSSLASGGSGSLGSGISVRYEKDVLADDRTERSQISEPEIPSRERVQALRQEASAHHVTAHDKQKISE